MPHLNQAILECQIHPDHINSSVSWFKEGVRLEPSAGQKYSFIKHENGTVQLLISNPSQLDSGRFTCRVEDETGREDETSHSLYVPRDNLKKEVAVEKERGSDYISQQRYHRRGDSDGEHKRPISLETHMRNNTIEEGGRAKLILNVLGPINSIIWKKDNVPIDITSNKRYRCVNQDGLISLEIQNATRDDSGFYTCIVSGDRNDVTSNSMLTVYETTPKTSKNVTSFSHEHHLPIPTFTLSSRGIFYFVVFFCYNK